MYMIKMDMIAFGVTRRCNQTCAHCCKGRAQNVDLSKEIIDCLIENKDYQIQQMTHFAITGGEPTLVPSIVSYLVDKIITKGIVITKHVNIFTNGLFYSEEFIRSIYRLIEYLKANEKSKKVQVYFRISQDQFHKKIPTSILEKYKKISFVSEGIEPYTLKQNQIQKDGNAKENQLDGTLSIENVPSINFVSKKDDTIVIKNALYISANGNVCSERYGCASFLEEDKYSYGNLLETSFLDIIHKFKKM